MKFPLGFSLHKFDDPKLQSWNSFGKMIDKIISYVGRFGRFVDNADYFASKREAACVYSKLAGKDENGMPLSVPMIVANKSDELRVYGIDGFNANFLEVVSLIANPGQGKSRLATAIYNMAFEL